MSIKINTHPTKSRNAMLVCDNCDKLIKNIDNAFDVEASNKPSHKLLLCKKCVPKKWLK